MNLGFGQDLDGIMEKNCDVFVIEKLYFVNILDFI